MLLPPSRYILISYCGDSLILFISPILTILLFIPIKIKTIYSRYAAYSKDFAKLNFILNFLSVSLVLLK